MTFDAIDETVPIETARKRVEARLTEVGLADTAHLPLDGTIRALRTDGAPHTLPILQLAEGATDAEIARAPDMIVERVLGEGGMGSVLLAEQRSLARKVAIKTVAPGAALALREALVSEGLITGALEHPVIPPVYALARTDDGRPLLVMKRIEGVPWTTLLFDEDHAAWQTLGGLPKEPLAAHLSILQRVADAAQFAHEAGILHRDIKTDNVMVSTSGEPYLVDWGIAERINGKRESRMVGTPNYIAPEMVGGEPLDARTDVYLLGATLHVVLTKKPRHTGATLPEVLARALASPPVTYGDDVPEELARLANAATRPNRAARPPTARAFREAIDAFLAHRSAAQIAEVATERLVALEAALEARADPASTELTRLATEALFGLTEARRLWPEGVVVVMGLRRARRAAIRLELRRENVAAARALLGEDDERDPELTRELATLEEALAARSRREAALVAEARERNPDLAVRSVRRRALPAVLGLQAILVVAQIIAGDMKGSDPVGLGAFVLALVFMTLAGLYAFTSRRDKERTELAGRMMLAPFALNIVLVAHRAMAWRDGSSLSQTLFEEMLILGTGLSAVGLIAIRVLIPGGLVFFATAVAIHLWPAWTRAIAHAGVTLVGVVFGLVFFRMKRAEARAEP